MMGRTRRRRHLLLASLAAGTVAAVSACAGPDSPSSSAVAEAGSDPSRGSDDAGIEGAPHDTPPNDGAPALAACAAPAAVGRAASWVRSHGPFVSGLNVGMGAPSAAAAADYFTMFHANAVHLWANGLPAEIEGWAQVGPAALPYVSWTQKDGTSVVNGQLLGGASPKPGRIGYQIGDEPLDMPTLKAMETAAKAAHAADPSALIILNYTLDPAGTDALLAYGAQIPEVDVLSIDKYSYGKDAYDHAGRLRAAALASGKSYWRYLDGFRYTSENDAATEADFRWDAYLGVTYGFSGHTWFIYDIDGSNPDLRPLFFEAGGSFAATKTAQFQWAAKLNQELTNLGRATRQLRSTDVRYVPAIALVQPKGTVAWTRGAGSDPYLAAITAVGTARDALVGHFRDDCDEPYVFVQSAAHPRADFPNATDQPTKLRVDLDFGGATDASLDRSAILVLDATTGVVAPRALTPTGAATASIELEVPAGGGILFKYETARAFALK
jgi:hypothetical protein